MNYHLFSLGVAMGPVAHLGDRRGGASKASFAMDIEAGLRNPIGGWGRIGAVFTLWPMVGYSYGGGETRADHLFVAGLTLGVYLHTLWFGMSPFARFVVGHLASGGLAKGLRSGLRLEAIIGLFRLDVAHQALFVDGDTLHDLRVTLGMDLLMLGRSLRVFRFLFGLASV